MGAISFGIILTLCMFHIVVIDAQSVDNSENLNRTSGRAFPSNPFAAFYTNFNPLNNFNGFNTFGNLLPNRFQQVLYSECTTQLGTSGICMRPLECAKTGGTASGFCSIAAVCCSVSLQCSGSSSAKRIVMEGSNSATTSTTTVGQSCTYTINRFSQYVCQLRVDFTTNMPQPSTTPVAPSNMLSCAGTYLQINNMRFCGVNNNQHVYVPFNLPAATQQITAVIGATINGASPTASWRIVVTQLECPPSSNLGTATSAASLGNNFLGNNVLGTTTTAGTGINNLFTTTQNAGQLINLQKLLKKRNFDTDLIAPNGCLQYFPTTTGTFESFNYNNGVGPYPADMQYAICFYRPTTASGIQFAASRFSMSFNNGAVDPMLNDDCFDRDGVTPTATNDYLFIPFSTLVNTPTASATERYCGIILENMNLIANPPGPFMVIVNTGNVLGPLDPGLDMTRAFRITYSVI